MNKETFNQTIVNTYEMMEKRSTCDASYLLRERDLDLERDLLRSFGLRDLLRLRERLREALRLRDRRSRERERDLDRLIDLQGRS